MKILLLNPRLKRWSPNAYVPLGLAYIAAVLERSGEEVAIIDLNVQKMNNNYLQQRIAAADIVGITGMITEYEEVLELVDLVKGAADGVKVMLGGPLATTFPRELLEMSPADFIVIGEGEQVTLNLVSALKNGGCLDEINGIAYRNGRQIVVNKPAEPIADLDTIPFPARHLLNMNAYLRDYFDSFGIKVKGFGKIKCTNLVSSRGCPYNCTFCFKNMWGQQWRARSAENIIDEIESLHSNYGVNGFFFNDDTFVLDRKRVLRFCQLLKERRLEVAWYCNGRINLMTRDLLQVMYDAGCRGIAYGIESGNQQILDSMKKHITIDQIKQVVQWTKEAGIHTTGYFMIGMLGETKATIEETLAFARELDLDFYGFSITAPLFGTELYDSALRAGLIPQNDSSLKEWGLYVNANLTRDCGNADLTSFANQAFREFFLEKRFGKYFFVNPHFLREEVKVLLSLRHKEQAKELVNKAKGLAGSYWHNSSK